MRIESPESISRSNTGLWPYSNGWRIERAWGNIYAAIGPNAEKGIIGGLAACHEWLTARDCWPVVIRESVKLAAS
jgi:hypothetical protein